MNTDRQTLVDRARDGWIRRLIDLSRRNNLLYYRDLKNGTLDLTAADPTAMQALLSGEAVSLSRLLPEADQTRTAAVAREVFRRAQSNLEEKGLQTLYLALGMATWTAADEGRAPEAAVLLLPAAIEWKGAGRGVTIRRAGDAALNLVLLHVLEVEHGVTIDGDELLAPPEGAEETPALDPEIVFARLRLEARSVRGFAIASKAVVGNFSFQKMAMVRDLQDNAAALSQHDLIAAMAGDGAAAAQFQIHAGDLNPADLDETAPDAEFLILDADSSQHRVTALVARGQSVVIQGPPGTGKSQTIANAIASLVAEGRRILFVAEKRAALEVVHDRLNRAGLGHMALDLHGADISRADVMRRVAQNLTLVREAPSVDGDEVHRRFTDARGKLLEHVRRLHVKRAPFGLSVYEMQGQLLRLPKAAANSVRWRGADLEKLDAKTIGIVEDALVKVAGFAPLFLKTSPSPWTGAVLPDGQTTQQAVDLVHTLDTETPELLAELDRFAVAAALPAPVNLSVAVQLMDLLSEASQMLATYRDDLFRHDLTALKAALAPGTQGALSGVLASVFNGPYRIAVRTVRELRRDGQAVHPAQMLAEVTAAQALLERWRHFGGPVAAPVAVPGSPAMRDRVEALAAAVDRLGAWLQRPDLRMMERSLFLGFVSDLHADESTPHLIAPLLQTEQVITQPGCGAIVADIRRTGPPPEVWAKRCRYAWLQSCMDRVRADEPEIAGFQGRTHDKYAEEFRLLDRQRVKLAAQRVRRHHAEHAVAVMNALPDQEALVRREAEKRSRHMPLRKLLAEAPEVLTALFPCWMASPLSVSQLMDANRRYFHIVMFDEASQVLPEDAIPSLMRASQAVIAGDEHQLPPTQFFADGAGEEEDMPEDSLVAGFESLLKLTSAFLPQRWLQWHYRSQDESLIAFSNRHVYEERLVTFPGIGGSKAIRHVLVDDGGQEESSAAEVATVVDLVLEHARQRPKESLGVITMGIKHANRVQAAIDEALRRAPELEPVFDSTRKERFFVKNLERVQGDERDAIILSIGYGKDRTGKLPYRFGPLLHDGGERRLNVAVTRARRHMTLVSSFTHLDMDPGRSSARGVQLLRAYLEYTARPSSAPRDAGAAVLDAFEQDVYETLSAAGVALLPHWGVSSYRVDMVARHPLRPERMVLAIECDGPGYLSAPTVRDRDRLRQQQLETLGWKYHRIWSPDWFMRREQEVERAVAAYKAAVASADVADGVAEVPPQAQPVAAVAAVTPAAVVEQSGRAPKPALPLREKIEEYLQSELDDLVEWVKSDGRLRTDDEILDQMVQELGFKRRGARIEQAVRAAIERTRD